eukprot:403357576
MYKSQNKVLSTATLLALAYLIPATLQNQASVAAAKFLYTQLEMYPSETIYKPQQPQSPAINQEMFEIQYRCQYMSGLNFYDLKSLSSAQYMFPSTVNDYWVMFCSDLPDAKSCNSKTMVTQYLKGTNTCSVLAGSDPTKDADFEVLNEDDNQGLKITYINVENTKPTCEGQPTFQIQISCDANAYVVDGFTIDETGCYPVLAFKHKSGCKIGNLSALWQWFTNNKWVMFVTFVIIGSIVCFLGRTLFKPVLFIAGVLLSVSLIWIIFYSTFLNEKTATWIGWVVLAGSILFGLIIGCLLVKLVKLGAFILSAWGGYALALLIYNAFLYKMNSNVGFWCFTIGIALLFGILALFFFDHILIHSTAIAGSFLFIMGIGLVADQQWYHRSY